MASKHQNDKCSTRTLKDGRHVFGLVQFDPSVRFFDLLLNIPVMLMSERYIHFIGRIHCCVMTSEICYDGYVCGLSD